jgi:hypothetical protein
VPAAAAVLRFIWQLLHRVIPRRSQMMQMNVPQSTHGYPSDARSSLPQDRHTILSCSRGLVIGGKLGLT